MPPGDRKCFTFGCYKLGCSPKLLFRKLRNEHEEVKVRRSQPGRMATH